MKPVAASAPRVASLREAVDAAWRERSGRLFSEFERPAKAMVRRAFRGAFCNDELDDIYASAWVGTLRALSDRQAELDDGEIRSYVLTAVANQAGKELRRRRRKPTAPLELVGSVPDQSDTPEERAASREESLIARDVLASLPPRRRAVMLLRYGWGLEPSQVCGLIAGLSPRAYRKEVTRGIDELTEKMRVVESGDWCADREPVLKAFVAGLAGEEEGRQARAHLSHCRQCSEFVARLSGHLHDLGGTVAAIGTIDGLDGHIAIGDRLAELGDRASGLLARSGSSGVDDTASQLVTSGGVRGAGAAGAGALTKLASVGAAGKLALACVGGGIAATACVAAGVTPFGLGRDQPPAAHERAAHLRSTLAPPEVSTDTLPSQVGNEFVPPAPATGGSQNDAGAATEPTPAAAEPEPEAAPPAVAATAPPPEQELGVAAAATPVPERSAPAAADGGGSAEAAAVHQEFGP
jgi:RNA polymerase sigma factor (sigma-70 family)